MRALGQLAGSIVALCTGIGALSGVAQAQEASSEPGSNQLIAFDGKEYSGAAKVFTLESGQLYSFVPSLGDLSGRVSSFKLGSEVGAILFEDPLFQTTDKGCSPLLGTREEPQMLWQGATADLLPKKRTGDGSLSLQAPKDDAYSSMVIYRRDVGPPPGILMLQRLNTYSRGCSSVLEQLNYRRVFVPAWDGGKTGYCQNLVGPTSYGGARGTFRFDNSDQLVFMYPEAMDRAYQTVKHRVRATLYDFPDCQGNHVTFPFKAESIRKFNLADYGYKGRARSIKVEYVSGPAYSISPLAVASVAPTTIIAQPSVASPAPASPTVVDTSAKSASVAPSVQENTLAVQQQAPTAPLTKPAPVLEAPKVVTVDPAPSVAALPSSPTPIQTQQVPVYSSTDADLVAAGITPAGDDALIPKPTLPSEGDLQRQVITSKSENPLFSPSYQLFEGQPDTNVSAQPVTSSQGSLPTEVDPQIASRPAGGTTYEFPVFDAYRLNYCLTPGTNCGEPAAREWCKKKGHNKVLAWKRDDNIGSLFPTINMGTNEICASYRCDGFKELTCGN